jgi:glutathione synthase/RimK-type ligase-like ATP-grasp enzyme
MKIFTTNTPEILSKQFIFTCRSYEPDIKLHLIYDNGKETSHDQLMNLQSRNIPTIGIHRFCKMQQSLILDRFNILTPKSYFSKELSCFESIQEFDSYCELEEFIVKPLMGAKGIGVKKINRKQFKLLLDNPSDNVKDIYKNELEHQLKYYPTEDPLFIESHFINKHVLVQEPLDIKREFRLLCFPEEYLIYERIKQEGQFLGNLSHGSKAGEVEQEFHETLKPLIGKIRTMMSEYKYPWLSLDLYVDKDNNLGVIEFQMEFAYEGFKPIDVRNCMENSINYYIKKLC